MLVNSNLALPEVIICQVEVRFSLINTGNVGQLESSLLRVRRSRRFLLINTVDDDEVSSVRLAGPATQSSFSVFLEVTRLSLKLFFFVQAKC